ncbi:MAG: hypothetical protein P1V35_16145, partial [Planctomycetota bacterium]|nr:hypothetical protein [Planctomycetota bacterium]
LLSSLAFSFILAVPQVPVHEGPEAPTQEAQPTIEDQTGFWKLHSKVVGGEWQVDEHFNRKIFHRFVSGPSDACIYVETRDSSDLEKPLPGLRVIFPDLLTGKVRGIEIADRGAFFDSVYRWEGDKLIRDYSYHLTDGSMVNGEVQETKMELENHWSFEGKSAYRWQLYQKTPAGVTQLIETSFHHRAQLTQLPKPGDAAINASVPLTFLDPLLSKHTSPDNWFMESGWRVKGMGLWTQRNMPNPNFGWDKTAPKVLEVEGFFYWNPNKKGARFIGFSKEGALVEGMTTLNPRQQIESTYTVGPTSASEPITERRPGPLGEQIQTLEDGSLKITWVMVGTDGKPTISEATLK